MARSSRKEIFFPAYFYRTFNIIKSHHTIYSRSAKIPEHLLGQEVGVYSGKIFRMFNITKQQENHRFGEFVLTRAFHVPKKKKNKQLLLKKKRLAAKKKSNLAKKSKK
jgi:ribosomal protein S19